MEAYHYGHMQFWSIEIEVRKGSPGTLARIITYGGHLEDLEKMKKQFPGYKCYEGKYKGDECYEGK